MHYSLTSEHACTHMPQGNAYKVFLMVSSEHIPLTKVRFRRQSLHILNLTDQCWCGVRRLNQALQTTTRVDARTVQVTCDQNPNSYFNFKECKGELTF